MEAKNPQEEAEVVEGLEERIIKALTYLRGKPKLETPTYSGSLNPKELIDWARDMENFFDMEQIEYPKRVNMDCMKLKGHASLWWDTMQLERKRKGKDKIRNRERMVAKLKGKFILAD